MGVANLVGLPKDLHLRRTAFVAVQVTTEHTEVTEKDLLKISVRPVISVVRGFSLAPPATQSPKRSEWRAGVAHPFSHARMNIVFRKYRERRYNARTLIFGGQYEKKPSAFHLYPPF